MNGSLYSLTNIKSDMNLNIQLIKRLIILIVLSLAICLLAFTRLNAQDNSEKSNFSVGADFYSNYIWRGSKFGQGPAIQPTVKFVTGGLNK